MYKLYIRSVGNHKKNIDAMNTREKSHFTHRNNEKKSNHGFIVNLQLDPLPVHQMHPRFQWVLRWSCCQALYTVLSTFVCCCFCFPSQHQLFLGLRLLIILSLFSNVVPTGYVEVIILKVLQSPPRLGCPLWNTCKRFTNNHGYVPFVVITGFAKTLTRWVPRMEQQLLTLLEHMCSLLIFSGIRVTRSLMLCVCVVDHCLCFCALFF